MEDYFGVVLFLLFLLVSGGNRLRRWLGEDRSGEPRHPRPVARPLPPLRPREGERGKQRPDTRAPAAGWPFEAETQPQLAGEGVGMEGPADMSVEDVAGSAGQVASEAEQIGRAEWVTSGESRVQAESEQLSNLRPLAEADVPGHVKGPGRPTDWPLMATPEAVRLAVVMAEVLGPPRARRPFSWRFAARTGR